ncbi:unnamed protein product [Phytophthora fragariaefolia]|uniref:Unnamed protein product n=1 Tax=Phytophthora fragariaefolia TaxID=1490495 RepID=A0A9W7CPM1_9STRA|nr:unnamed protein product [Phytophthora fragariaefolia]
MVARAEIRPTSQNEDAGKRSQICAKIAFAGDPRARTMHESPGNHKGKDHNNSPSLGQDHFGWERVYVFELRIMDHNAGVDVVLGTDFMIPAGVRLDLFQANAELPDEVMIPLIKTISMLDEP